MAFPALPFRLLAFPIGEVDEDILHEIVRGGSDKMKEARVAVIGGHSVQDPEIKFGYCATGDGQSAESLHERRGPRRGMFWVLTKRPGDGHRCHGY